MRKLFFVCCVIVWVQLASGMIKSEPELIQAVSMNRLGRVRVALREGADVNVTNSHGSSALMFAAFRGYYEICCVLIRAGANVNLKNVDEKTAFSVAVSGRHWMVTLLLVDCGADVSMPVNNGRTPLMKLIKSGGRVTDIEPNVECLLDWGADPNVQRKKTLKTALMYAVKNEDRDLCALLLKHGARVDLKNKKGQTALILAACYGEGRICEMLVNHQARLDRRMRSFLCRLKRSQNPSARALYGLRRDLLSPYLKQFSLPLLLKTRDMNGFVAFNYLPYEFLNPYPRQQLIENTEEKTVKKKMDKKNKKCVVQ
jgi:ankyrin repeat protein